MEKYFERLNVTDIENRGNGYYTYLFDGRLPCIVKFLDNEMVIDWVDCYWEDKDREENNLLMLDTWIASNEYGD